jgi:hypothetical protein
MERISLNDAVAKGIVRLREPRWANPLDHLKIDIIDGQLGPWLHLFAPFNKTCNGRDPVDMLSFQFAGALDAKDFVPYEGPLPDSAEYQRAVQAFGGVKL